MKNLKTSQKLKKHWSNRLGKLQVINSQEERLTHDNSKCIEARFRLTQLAIKFKI